MPATGRARTGTGPVTTGRTVPGLLCLTLRLPAFVAVNAALGLTAHTVDTAMLPGPSAVAAALLGVLVVGLVLCRRERSFEAICTALLAGQAVTHVALCAPAALAGSTAGAVHAHGVGGGLLGALAPSSSMLVAHLLAAGVAAWWLHRGETAVWNAVRRTMPTLAPLGRGLPFVPARTTPRVCAHTRVVVLHDQVGATRTRPRRGPPLPLAA